MTVSLPNTSNAITLGGLQIGQTWTSTNIWQGRSQFDASIEVTPVNEEFSQFGPTPGLVTPSDTVDRLVSVKQATTSGVRRAAMITGEIVGPSTNAGIKMAGANIFVHVLDTTDANLTSTSTFGSYVGSRLVGRIDGTSVTITKGTLQSFALLFPNGSTSTVTTHCDLLFEAGNIVSGSTVTNYNRILINNPTVGGTLTTQTGIRIEDLTSATTDFAIFLEGTNNKVHFNQAGESIGSSSTSHLDLIGTTNIDFIIGSTEQMNLQDGVFGPTTDSDVDLGTTTVRWKDAFVDSLAITGAIEIGGDLNHDGSNIGFFGTAPVAQGTSGADLTNNVTSGGTDDTVDNITLGGLQNADLTSTRNAVYQLARKLKQVNDTLRDYGMLT